MKNLDWVHYIIDIIDQKAIRIAIDELYIALDFGYEVFNAKIADAKVKQKLIDDIKKDLHSNDITAEEIWQRLDNYISNNPLLRGFVACSLDQNTQWCFWTVIFYTKDHYNNLIQKRKKNLSNFSQRVEWLLQQFDTKRNKYTQIIPMLFELQEFCKIIISSWDDMVSKAEQSTLDYIKSNNSSKEIYEYGLSINEYFEEVSVLNLTNEECASIFRAMMFSNYFADHKEWESISSQYDSVITDVFKENILNNWNEISSFVWDPRDYEYWWVIYSSSMDISARAIIIDEYIDKFFSKNKITSLNTNSNNAIENIEKLLKEDTEGFNEEEQKFITTIFEKCYTMGDYRFDLFYKEKIRPFLSIKRRGKIQDHRVLFLEKLLSKYSINPGYEYIDDTNKLKEWALSKEEYDKKRWNYF